MSKCTHPRDYDNPNCADCDAEEIASLRAEVERLKELTRKLTAATYEGAPLMEWVARAEAAEAERDALQKELDGMCKILASRHDERARLRAALEGLLDVQNGPPLLREKVKYDEAVRIAREALKEKP